MLLLSFAGTIFLLLADKAERWATTLFGCMGFFIGYHFQGFNPEMLVRSVVLAIIFGVGLVNYDIQLGNKYRNMIKPRFIEAISDSSGGFLVFFSLIIAMNFYLFNNSQEQRYQLIHKSLSLIVDPVSKVTEHNEMKLFSNLSPELKSLFGIEEQESEQTTTQPTSTPTPFTQQMTENLKSSFARELEPYTTMIINIISVAIFFTLFSVFKLAKIAIWPMGFLIFEVLKSTGYIKETRENVEVTRYTI